MFRLIKLAMYAMIGYVLYELYQGMTQPSGARSSFGGEGEGFGQGRSFAGQGGRAGTLTGGGEGMSESAADTGGGEMRHTVGRGVVGGTTL